MQYKEKKLVIGLTGGIGSGKSLVTKMFADFGVTIADADVVARDLVLPNSYALNKIVAHFGADILQEDGALNRPKLREKIFADIYAKKFLEDLLHPLIRQKQHQIIAAANSPYALLVSPLLIEAEQTHLCNRVLAIVASEQLRLQRIMARDNLDLEQAQNILAQQLTEAEYRAHADDVIENNTAIDMVRWQVQKLHEMYLGLCAK